MMNKICTKNIFYQFIAVMIIIFAICFASWHPVNALANVLYVTPGGVTSGTCSSWGTACSLQYALSIAVVNDELWVMQGTYVPTDGIDRTATFQLKNGVSIYGGFIGTESNRDDRNWELNVTYLSGDIGLGGDTSDNAYHVVTSSSTNSSAILDGFTITGGNANGTSVYQNGAGIYNYAGSPSLANIIFTSNSASGRGGGFYNSGNSNPSLANTTFESNSATLGGGIYDHLSNPTLVNATFTNNTANDGGGMYNDTSSPSLTTVAFSGNTAVLDGGGLHNYHLSNPVMTDITFESNAASDAGGGIYNLNSSPSLTAVTLKTNTAPSGAGMYTTNGSPSIEGASFITNTATTNGGGMFNFNANLTVSNSTFSGNQAGSNGGGIYNTNSTNLTLNNVSLFKNSATILGGGAYIYTSSGSLTNVTFTSNSATYGGGVYNYTSSPNFEAVTFTGNTATIGGGMYDYSSSNPVLNNVNFNSNIATDMGGGMYNLSSAPSLTNTTYQGNIATNGGGGMYNSSSDAKLRQVIFDSNVANNGAGLYNNNSNPSVADVNFTKNSANLDGGGAYNYYSNVPILVDVTFSGNTAGGLGGGLYNYYSLPSLANVEFTTNAATYGGGIFNSYSDLGLSNGSFYNNTAETDGGGIYNSWSNSLVYNSILWGNDPGQVINDLNGNSTIAYSDLQGGCSAGSICDHVIDADPLFVDPAAGDLRLSASSPAIDAGDNSSVPADLLDLNHNGNITEPLPYDLTGNPRFIDVPEVVDTGLGTPPIVDMGANEAGLKVIDLDLWQTTDPITVPWEKVPGSYTGGFNMLLDTEVPWYYFNTETITSNRALADGTYPFYFTAYPDGFFDYWAGRGVYEGAPGWQGYMWEIINNEEPIFLLKVTGTDYMLVDGLGYLMSGLETPLRIDGTYLIGAYAFGGSVSDAEGDTSNISVNITLTNNVQGTTTSVDCGDGDPTVTYGSSISCVATVVRAGGDRTPGGTVNWTTDGSGSFVTSPCTLSGADGTATCSVVYTPSAVGSGTHLITAIYGGDINFTGSTNNQAVTVAKADASCAISGYTGVYDAIYHGASGTCSGIGGENPGVLDLGDTFMDVPGGTAHWTLTGNGNYNDQSGDVEIVISEAEATCTIEGYSGVYDAALHGASGDCTGIGVENPGTLDLGETFKDVPGGTAHWIFTGNGNYTDQEGDVDIEISKADPVCEIFGYSVPYDRDPHTADGSCIGVEDELLSGLNLESTTHTEIGTYIDDPWVFTDQSGDYNDASGVVTDTITLRYITITADAKYKSFGQPDPQLTYQITTGSLLEGDTVSGHLTRVSGEAPGTYAILKGTLSLPDYYVITYVGADFTIYGHVILIPIVYR
jgi:hypothetical protein